MKPFARILERFGPGGAAALAVSALSILAAPPARAADWPQWRGPDRDGISKETGLLEEWPEAGPPLAWKATGLGMGHSSVSVANGRVYTMGDGPDGSYVRALDETSGNVLWSTKLGRAGGGEDRTPDRTGTRCTPTVDGDRLYVLGQYGELACLATDGKEVWRADLVKSHGGRVQRWGYAESPLVDGDRIVVTPGGAKGTVLALDKTTGKPLWQSREWTDPAHYSSPIVATIGGVRQYVQQTEKSVAGVAADDGRLLWKADRPEGRVAVVPTPVEKDGLVYVAAGYGVGCHAFKVTPPAGGNVGGTGGGNADGKFSVEQVYANTDMKNHHGGVILLGDHVYGTNDPGILTCMELKTGEVAWKDRSVGKGSVVIADGRLYLRSEQPPGRMALVEATPEGYKELGTFSPPDPSGKPTWPHPVVANGKLYLRDQDVLLCYDVKAK